MRSTNVLLLDHHTEILIWEGNLVGEKREQWLSTAQSLAAEKSANRFPRPYIMQFKERSSMARWLLCRLIPSHKDPKSRQSTNFPDINSMSELEYQSMMSAFHDTDDLSFLQYQTLILENH